MAHVLVTGGCGFIGANLVPRLQAKGHDVRVIDDLRTGRRDYLGTTDVEIMEASIGDRSALAKALVGIESVIHLAAAGSVVDSVTDPASNFEANAQGTFVVLDEARLAGVERVVFASTGGALIGNADPPVDERSLPKPISPYGASKLAAEAYCHAFSQAYGMRTIATRFANVYGPYSGHKKGAISAFFKALDTGDPIIIYGDGSASRDFMYVDDICAGLELALQADVLPGSVFHLATGRETTVRELAELCRQVADRPDHKIEFRGRRAGEVERNFATFDRAEEELGFRPMVELPAGLSRTWNWYCDHVFSD